MQYSTLVFMKAFSLKLLSLVVIRSGLMNKSSRHERLSHPNMMKTEFKTEFQTAINNSYRNEQKTLDLMTNGI